MKVSLFAPLLVSLILLVTATPAKADFIGWAANMARNSLKGCAINGISVVVLNCAMSTTCIPGQDISMITNDIHKDKIFEYSGCFDLNNQEAVNDAGVAMARRISQRSRISQ